MSLKLLAMLFICMLLLVSYFFQNKNDNSPHDNNSSHNDSNNETLKRYIYGAIVLILGFIGPYVVEYFGEVEKNGRGIFLDIAEDWSIFSQDTELMAASKKKSVFAMEANLDKLFKRVPDVKGLTQEAAGKRLEEEGIPWHVGDSVYSDKAEAGIVLSQIPEAEGVVTGNSAVALVISIGPKPVQVPNVVGMSKKKAKNKLEKSGLKVTVEEEEGYNDTVKAGDVVTQSTNEGESVPPGTEIRIVISKGEKPTPTETPKPTPTEAPVPTETPEPPSPTPTEAPVPTQPPEPTQAPLEVPEEVMDDSDGPGIPEEEVD